MRTFFLTVFWVFNVGNVIQLIVIATGSWLLISGAYTFSDLHVYAFVTEVVPWLQWIKTLLLTFFGQFGEWMLGIPILIIAPLKFIAGIFIGVWAYTAAYNLPVEPARA